MVSAGPCHTIHRFGPFSLTGTCGVGVRATLRKDAYTQDVEIQSSAEIGRLERSKPRRTQAAMNSSPSTFLQPDDAYRHRMTVAFLLSVVSVLGVVGNGLLLFSVAACRKLQTLPNAFVVSLSVSDFLNCSVNIPVQMSALTRATHPVSFEVACRSTAVLNYILITCSIVMLDLIAINRFVLITQSHRVYGFVYTKRNMIVTIGGVWTSTSVFLIALGPTRMVPYGFSDILWLCQLSEESRLIDVICGLLFGCSFITVSFCYIRIYFFVRRHMRQVAHIRARPGRPTPSTTGYTSTCGGSNEVPPIETVTPPEPKELRSVEENREETAVDETENRITMNMIMIVVCFFICISPTLAMVLVPGTQSAGMYTVLSLYSASCCNPIIYAWKHPVFRKVFKCIFSRRFSDIEDQSAWLRTILSK
ncbi:melatonin receptor type 1A-like [Diadema antillarum]|uniref:melatonin receptor type 1A-like n=1 Tax=Diadema antillarum TaxID=105358 RepID=UPI003A88F695